MTINTQMLLCDSYLEGTTRWKTVKAAWLSQSVEDHLLFLQIVSKAQKGNIASIPNLVRRDIEKYFDLGILQNIDGEKMAQN